MQLSPINIDIDYRKEWQIIEHDFVVLTRDGELVNDNLFRVGGLSANDIANKNYFLLIKYREAFYSDDVMKYSKSVTNKHLAGHWCIVDNKGVIRFEAPSSYEDPYLLGGCLYSYKKGVYNIETGYCYAENVHKSISSDNYLCLENAYDRDKTKRGIIKINKYSGEFELLK